MKRFLAFDIGASNGRAIVGEFDGSRLVSHDIHHFANEPVQVHGNLYWDVLRLFSEVREGILKYRKAYGPDMDGIGIDTWGVDFGLFDADGRLLGNPHCYRDARFAGADSELKQLLDGYEVFAETGVIVQQVATITQMYTLARDLSPQLGSATRFLHTASILNYFLTGECVDEQSNISNSGLVGYRDRRPLRKIMEKMGIPTRILPHVVQTGQVIGEPTPALREQLGIRKSPVVACATHDTASAVISVPAQPGTDWAFISCGTWSVVGVETDKPETSRDSYESNLTSASTAEGRFMTRLNLTGLWIVQELRRQWALAGRLLEWGQMTAMAESAPSFTGFIDVDDPVFALPSDMSGAIVRYLSMAGQNPPEDDGQLLRIAFESLAMKYRQSLDTVKRLTGRSVDVMHMVGGGVRNELLCRMTADALGIPVIAGPAEATSAGNILVQMIGADEINSVAEGRTLLAPSFDLQEYRPHDTAAWDEAYEKYLMAVRRN